MAVAFVKQRVVQAVTASLPRNALHVHDLILTMNDHKIFFFYKKISPVTHHRLSHLNLANARKNEQKEREVDVPCAHTCAPSNLNESNRMHVPTHKIYRSPIVRPPAH